MGLIQSVGLNNIERSSAISITMNSGLSQNVLTLSSSFSNIFRAVERLVEVQERQIESQKTQIAISSKLKLLGGVLTDSLYACAAGQL